MGFIVPDADRSRWSPTDDAEWQSSGRRGQRVGCVGRPGSWQVAAGRMSAQEPGNSHGRPVHRHQTHHVRSHLPVSRTSAITSSTGPRPAAAGASARRRFPRPSAVTTVIIVATVVGLALRLYQLSRPGYLLGITEYDDGTDFGSAVRLIHGALPYRDFIMVQPPGITLLMAPVALVTKTLGTVSGMAAARVLTAVASAAAVPLAGLLTRHRGLLAVTVTCGILAVYPDSLQAARTVLLEPWLVLFCLLGALAVFDGDRLAGGRRLVWGGLAFGFAGAVKVWAILPVLVIIALSARRPRQATRFGAGVAAGFLAAVLPFA